VNVGEVPQTLSLPVYEVRVNVLRNLLNIMLKSAYVGVHFGSVSLIVVS